MSLKYLKVQNNLNRKFNIKKSAVITVSKELSGIGSLGDDKVEENISNVGSEAVEAQSVFKKLAVNDLKCYKKKNSREKNKKHTRYPHQKKLHKFNRMKRIKDGQWDNYLRHAAALLLHGIQHISKEPEKRKTKNSMKTYKDTQITVESSI